MAGVRSLDLPVSPRAAVFRAMETIVRGNAVFQRIVKPDRFRTWEGEPRDIKPFTQAEAPCMRWTPAYSQAQFATPNLMVGDLLINCEMITRGSCCDDITNFWFMLEMCLYPDGITSSATGDNTVQQTLRNAGAHTGLVLFTQPAFDPDPDGVFFAGQGQMKITVRLAI